MHTSTGSLFTFKFLSLSLQTAVLAGYSCVFTRVHGAVAELIEDFEAVDLVLKAGDVSVHNPRIVHGSNANNSDRRRGGLTIRYM